MKAHLIGHAGISSFHLTFYCCNLRMKATEQDQGKGIMMKGGQKERTKGER